MRLLLIQQCRNSGKSRTVTKGKQTFIVCRPLLGLSLSDDFHSSIHSSLTCYSCEIGVNGRMVESGEGELGEDAIILDLPLFNNQCFEFRKLNVNLHVE